MNNASCGGGEQATSEHKPLVLRFKYTADRHFLKS
jgi:hypothetical protein